MSSEAVFVVNGGNVMVGEGAEIGIGTVKGIMEDPMNRLKPPVAKLIAVLEIVIAEPGKRVCDPMIYSDAEMAVIGWEPTLTIETAAKLGGEGSELELAPMKVESTGSTSGGADRVDNRMSDSTLLGNVGEMRGVTVGFKVL